MHVFDYILDKVSKLFRFNNYPLYEKAYSIMFHIAGLSLLELLEVENGKLQACSC